MGTDPSDGVPGTGTPSVFGRDELLEQVVGLVRTTGLVTLVGTGGVGKTTLASAVARQVGTEMDGGVRFVELGPLDEATSVPTAIATALGVAPRDRVPLLDVVAEALDGRPVLLVLDNCEHVLDGAGAAVATLLERSRSTRVLTTSREALRVPGEQRVSVPPLTLDGGASSVAVELFVDRAREVRPGFSLDDPALAEAVVEICAALDGLPLAIELAAARMGAMGPVDLRDRLDQRVRLLRGSSERPERHQTLRAVVRWSVELLDPGDREALWVAASFAGGFDLAGLAALLTDAPAMTGVDEVEVLDRLTSLARQSLVVVDHQPTGTARYRLLETIRSVVEAELAESGHFAPLRDRHAAHFAREAAARGESWNGPGWGEAVVWLRSELANLRAALRWSAARDQVVVATDIAAHAAVVGVMADLLETVGWAESMLDAATAAEVPRLPRLCTAAGYACFVGRAAHGATYAHRATELEQVAGTDPFEPGLATFVEALATVYAGDLQHHVQLLEGVAALPGSARAFVLPGLVDGWQASGRIQEAQELSATAVAAARDVGCPFWITYSLWTAGQAWAHTDRRRALAAWDEGTAVVEADDVRFFRGFLARDAARVRTTGGDPRLALEQFVVAVEAFRSAGNVPQLVITLASIPPLLERLGRLEAAATLRAAVAREPASLRHVPELADLDRRLAERLDPAVLDRCGAAGAGLDLAASAEWARAELVEALAGPVTTPSPPGGLTRRQLDVLELLARGLTTREIADELFISAKTADHHIQHVYTRIGVSNRAAATRWAVDHGVGTGPP